MTNTAKERFNEQYGKEIQKKKGVIEFVERDIYDCDAIVSDKKGKAFFEYNSAANNWSCLGFKPW